MLVTNCSGQGCPIKLYCSRNKTFQDNKVKHYGDNYWEFDRPPFKLINDIFECEMFLGDMKDYLKANIK